LPVVIVVSLVTLGLRAGIVVTLAVPLTLAMRCGRTHCRYSGPYYFAVIAPVVVLGSGVVSGGIHAWLVWEA
jgi:hypothetical protein